MALQETWSKLRDLPVRIEAAVTDGLESHPASPWLRRTTVLRLLGPRAGEGWQQPGGLSTRQPPDFWQGFGEDVNWSAQEQEALQRDGLPGDLLQALTGEHTLGSLAGALDAVDCGPVGTDGAGPTHGAARLYRRWAIESAALDLALRQAGTDLAEVLCRPHQPLRFVTSLNLDQPVVEPLEELRTRQPGIGFKVDWSPRWPKNPDAPFFRSLRELGGVAVVDFKGHYHGAFQGPPPDAAGYRAVAEALPDAILEDPAWTPECAEVLAPHRQRVAFDAPLHSRADLDLQPVVTGWANVKPSRFGRLSELCAFLDLCANRGIRLYGGGQYELGVGRRQIQELAALFHPDGPNDVAPVAFHQWREAEFLPESPLRATGTGTGFPSRTRDPG